MSRKGWIDQAAHRVLPAAFIRRPPPADGSGLSVDIESPSSCHESLNKCHGVVSLHVGRVRELRLDIAPDEPPHANIVGVPRQEDDREEAEHLASQLAKQARIVPPGQYLDLA
jgi:hypothetical protein